MALAVEVKENEILKIGEAHLFFKKRGKQFVFYIEAPPEVQVLREKLISPEKVQDMKTRLQQNYDLRVSG